jgi:hypothetical protein
MAGKVTRLKVQSTEPLLQLMIGFCKAKEVTIGPATHLTLRDNRVDLSRSPKSLGLSENTEFCFVS